MVCKSCNFENKEGAAFCANCGKPLEAEAPAADASAMTPMESKDDEPKTVAIDSAFGAPAQAKEERTDDSESNTTVLTSNMMTPGAMAPSQAAPSGPIPGPMGGPAPMNQGAQKPMGGPAPMNQGAPKPMGGPAPMNQGAQKPMGGPAPMNQGAPKPAGAPAPKPAKPQKSGKMGTGAKVYIVISVVVILALIGVGVYGYMKLNDKVKDANAEKDNLASELDASSSSYEGMLSEKDSAITELETEVASYEEQVADYESQIAAYEENDSKYAAYDALIGFADTSVGQGYSDFFASDTILHLTGGQTAVKIYFAPTDVDVNVAYECADTSVATCEWGDGWENDVVATLYVTPVGSGNTTITLTNDQNSETITIFVYVD